MKGRYWVWLVAVMACGGVVPPDDQKCDPKAKFGTPEAVPGLATAGFDEGFARFSRDELTAYFSGSLDSQWDLYVAQRSSKTEVFMAPALITSQNSAAHDFNPTVSSDGLALWFESNRSNGKYKLYIATRASTQAEFGPPGLAAAVNSIDSCPCHEAQPFITADNAELWFASTRNDGSDWNIWYSMRTAGGFSQPVNALALSSSSVDWMPALSADRLTVYFSSTRGDGTFDIWTAHRSTINDGFPVPVLVDGINSAKDDHPAWLSADGCRLYLTSNRSGDFHVYMATR